MKVKELKDKLESLIGKGYGDYNFVLFSDRLGEHYEPEALITISLDENNEFNEDADEEEHNSLTIY